MYKRKPLCISKNSACVAPGKERYAPKHCVLVAAGVPAVSWHREVHAVSHQKVQGTDADSNSCNGVGWWFKLQVAGVAAVNSGC
jgi:hypothetical protein